MIRNRWHLFVTLQNNVPLRVFRKNAILCGIYATPLGPFPSREIDIFLEQPIRSDKISGSYAADNSPPYYINSVALNGTSDEEDIMKHCENHVTTVTVEPL